MGSCEGWLGLAGTGHVVGAGSLVFGHKRVLVQVGGGGAGSRNQLEVVFAAVIDVLGTAAVNLCKGGNQWTVMRERVAKPAEFRVSLFREVSEVTSTSQIYCTSREIEGSD